ncbi:hypothetical protein NHX12_010047 [Muraenolepis orangiensis]|uniref:Sushi domain-containing protein n=1 Tax=Muraenolepis orangiensis TaxID=630683 RepID=A0A9Q0DID0_9TELE|nr:hypothetical protein NHX12_010047 [Muraenolepis orangiensis]
MKYGLVLPHEDRYYVNNETTYECDTGYELRGSARRFCMENGKWNGSTPICSRDDDDYTYDTAEDINKEFGGGMQLSMTELKSVDKNVKAFYTHGNYNVHAMADDGISEFYDYDVALVELEEDVVFSADVSKAMRLDNITAANIHQVVTENFLCTGGTSPFLDHIACKVIECPNPKVMKYGLVLPHEDRYYVNNETTYECDTGYELHGSARRFCMENGKWNGSTPICSRDDHDYTYDTAEDINKEFGGGMQLSMTELKSVGGYNMGGSPRSNLQRIKDIIYMDHSGSYEDIKRDDHLDKNVKAFSIHGNYNIKAKEGDGISEFYDYDVALIELEEDVVFSADVRLA